jgi:hypothetical protein
MTINVYVTHHVTEALDGINDILIDQLYRMLPQCQRDVRLLVAYWTNQARYRTDLEQRVPSGVELLFNDREGRPDTQPSLRNKIVEHARQDPNCEAFLLIHNDVRFARGFVATIVSDWRAAEKRWGKDQTIVTPRYIPYHLDAPDARAVSKPEYWNSLRANGCVKTSDELRAWCVGWRFEFSEGEVNCVSPSSTNDTGHQLMMFITSPRFFDAQVGLCDEAFTGLNIDDCEWGMRALMAGKKNLMSTGALLGHIASLSFGPLVGNPEWLKKAANNEAVFLAKWGRDLMEEMNSGAVWARLHAAQTDRKS